VKFPCRIRQFATCCVLAEHYFQHRETIKTTLRAKLSKHKDVSQPLPPVEKRRAQRLTPGA
jgi:hypothetical protein